MPHSIHKSLERVGDGDRLLLAVSGGGDSYAMLKWFATEPKWQRRIIVAHVNHKIRSDASEVAELVQKQSLFLNVKCEIAEVDVPAELAQRLQSIEACARRLRYSALEKLRKKFNCAFIVTAHTLDDSAETVFMKLAQSSSWFECTGIPEQRGKIIRPFLTIRRQQLRAQLTDHDLYDSDPMNSHTRFPRVQARARLADSQLFTANVEQRLETHGRNVKQLELLTSKLLKLNKNKYLGNSRNVHRGLECLPKNLYLEDLDFLSVECAWASLSGQREGRLKASSRRQITEFLRGGNQRSSLALPNSVTLKRAGLQFWVENFSDESFSGNSTSTTHEIETPVPFMNQYSGALEFSSDFARSDLQVRSWLSGDRFRPASRRTRKISDWLADAGIHPSVRSQWPVICHRGEIIAVPGLGVSELAKLNGDATFLRIPWKAKSNFDR